MKTKDTVRTVLGFVEKITLVGKNGKRKTLRARIDSGATKSAVHIGLVRELKLGPAIGKKLVKSSNGQAMRPLIKATVLLAKKKITKDFTVANRDHLRYKVLIGQNILKLRGFIIDPKKK